VRTGRPVQLMPIRASASGGGIDQPHEAQQKGA
jgi:hypothetical protein